MYCSRTRHLILSHRHVTQAHVFARMNPNIPSSIMGRIFGVGVGSNTLTPSRRLALWTCMVHRESITTRRQESHANLLPQPCHHLSPATPSLSSTTLEKSLQTSRRFVKPREHSGPQLLVCEVVLLYLAHECDM